MSLSSVELWQRISAAGLAAPLICRSWAAEALQGLPPSDAANADKILGLLVKTGRLTNYQADLIAGRRQGDFKRGAWTLLGPVTVPLWGAWFEATKSPTAPTTWLRWLDTDSLTGLRTAAPSLPRGLRLAQIQGNNLQTVLIPELVDQQLELQVAPINGVPLSVACKTEQALTEKATQIVRQVAEALRPLHVSGIAHGRVLPDRIFWNEETQQATLARDPLCAATASLDASAIGVIEQNLAGLAATQFLAPEFLTPGQQPTIATDIYSLGCTWWWLITGRPLVNGSTIEKQLARQAEKTPALPKECSLPTPYVRVLQHCLAKNLPARFDSAMALAQALDVADAVVAKGQVPRSQLQSSNASQPPEKVQTTPSKTKVPELATPSSTKAKLVKPVTEDITKVAPLPEDLQTVGAQPGTIQPARETRQKPAAADLVPVEVVESATRTQPAADPSTENQPTPNIQPIATQPLKATPVKTDPVKTDPVKTDRVKTDPVKTDSVKTDSAENELERHHEVVAGHAKPKSLDSSAAAAGAYPIKNSAGSTAPKTIGKRKSKTVTKLKVAKRQKANKWVLPVIGGFGFISLLLLVVLLNGGLNFGENNNSETNPIAQFVPPAVNSQPEFKERDPRLKHFRIVSSGKDTLWAPPVAPQPLPVNLLPPGGQMFLAFHPKSLLNTPTAKTLLSSLNEDVTPWLNSVTERTGLPLESIQQCTVAFYVENGKPATCLRVMLAEPQSLGILKAAWRASKEEKVDSRMLLTNAAGESYYIAAQPLTDSQSVHEFSVGPMALMREVAEVEGEAAPFVMQMEKLWQVSDSQADFSLLLAPAYLFSEGRSLLEAAPRRLASQITNMLGTDIRAALLQTRLEPEWYAEVQLVGLQDRDAGRISEQLRQKVTGAASAVEEWFVSESPHPYWRSLAFRYPQMLRTLSEQARFGVENGVAIGNSYLPTEAAPNVLLTSWIASLEGATLASDMPAIAPTTVSAAPLTLDQYLGRSIKLSFDQEPIEVALKLIGDEANANLPAGTPPLRFELDGGAFEKAGITRNQQLRDFKFVDKPLREALTEVAKRGNPVTTVTDTRDKDQRLIWVVRDDPQQAGQKLVSLTTRDAALSNSIPLPIEFAPAN